MLRFAFETDGHSGEALEQGPVFAQSVAGLRGEIGDACGLWMDRKIVSAWCFGRLVTQRSLSFNGLLSVPGVKWGRGVDGRIGRLA